MWWMERSGRLVVMVHGDTPGTHEEFHHMMELGKEATQVGAGRMLVYAAGRGGPDPEQRRAIGDKLRAHGVSTFKTVVVTESALVRGIMTALSWVSPMATRCFAPCALDKAAEALDLSDEERSTLDTLLQDLTSAAGLPPPPCAAAG